MRKSIHSVAAAALLATLAPAAAAQPATAPQPSRWQVDGATNRCVLTRRLQGTPVPATFILRTIPGSQRYELILAGRDLPADIRRNGLETTLLLAPGSASFQGVARAMNLPGELERGVAFGPLPAEFPRQLRQATSLRLSAGADLGSWAIPSAAPAAEALAYCEAEKQVEWGADPASVEAGATPARPVGDSSSWLTTRDLGLTEALASAAFTAVLRLIVEPDGRAGSCTILESATNLGDPEDICRTLVRRARYEPARDARGTAVRSVAIHIVSMRVDIDFRMIGA